MSQSASALGEDSDPLLGLPSGEGFGLEAIERLLEEPAFERVKALRAQR